MSNPASSVIVVVSIFAGSLAHFITGGNIYRLLSNIVVALIGFALGQAVSEVASLHFLSLGPLNLLMGTLGALIALALSVILWRAPIGGDGQKGESFY